MFKKINRGQKNIRKKNVELEISNQLEAPKESIESVNDELLCLNKTEQNGLIKETTIVKEKEIQMQESNYHKNKEIKQKAKIKTKVALSFEDEESSIPEFKVKKSKNSRNLSNIINSMQELESNIIDLNEVSNSEYSTENLNKLRNEQLASNSNIKNLNERIELIDINHNVEDNLIPNKDEITLAKKERERRRLGVVDLDEEDPFLKQEGINSVDEDNIELDDSRFVREENEFGDGEEELNYYMGDNIKLRKGDMKAHLLEEEKEKVREAIEQMELNGDYENKEFLELELLNLERALGDPKIKHMLRQDQGDKRQNKLNKLFDNVPKISFTSIKMQLQKNHTELKNSLIPYEESISTNDLRIADIELKLKELNKQSDAINDRIIKYNGFAKTLSQ